MKKIITLLLILSVFVTISISYAQERWHTLKTITGGGPQTTDYFEIPTDEWRIVWSHSDLPHFLYRGWFSVNVYSEDEIYSQVGIIFSEGKETNGTLNIHEGKKKFYMVIEPRGVESYTMKVEYYEGSPSPEPTPTEEPQKPEQDVTAGAVLAVSSIVVFLGLLFYFIKRK